MFRTNKPSQHLQEVYNCIARNREAYIPMMSNKDLKEFTTQVVNNPLATSSTTYWRFIRCTDSSVNKSRVN